jgi:hypothetical protein
VIVMRTRVLLAIVIVAAGCGGTAQEAAKSSPSASPSHSAAVTVTRDVPYVASLGPGWLEPLLDVYAPKAASGLPLVVMFPAFPAGKNQFLPPVAEAVARQGAVVVTATYGLTGTVEPSAAAVVRYGQQMRAQGACAVSFAVAHAREYGADPGRIVLLGHSGGGNEALLVAFTRQPPAFPGCRAAATAFTVRGIVYWEGDPFMMHPDADPLMQGVRAVTSTGQSQVIASMTAWPLLATAPKVPVVIAVSPISIAAKDRCDSVTKDWLTWRDPNGWFRARLTAMGAYKNGCIGIGEANQLLADTMNADGIKATVLSLTDQSTHEGLGPADLTLLGRRAIELAGR